MMYYFDFLACAAVPYPQTLGGAFRGKMFATVDGKATLVEVDQLLFPTGGGIFGF